MAKVTSKYQVSIPKRLAEQLGISPGDDIDWSVAGEELRIIRTTATRSPLPLATRLEMFDGASARQAARNRRYRKVTRTGGRGWTRDELYDRGRNR